jgi:hypothetical protein
LVINASNMGPAATNFIVGDNGCLVVICNVDISHCILFLSLFGLDRVADLAMSTGVLAKKRSGHIDITTLTATLVFKAGGSKRDQCLELKVLGIQDVATTIFRHTGRVAVDQANESEIGLKQLDRQGHRARGCVLVDRVNTFGCVVIGAREFGNVLAELSTSNKRQRVRFTVDGKDRCDDVVEGDLSRSGTNDGSSRGKVVARDRVGRLSGALDPLTKTTHFVRGAATGLSLHLVVGRDGRFNVTLDVAECHCFGGNKVGGTSGANCVLDVGHTERAAELLNVVTNTGTINELVVKQRNVCIFAHTIGARSVELVHNPLRVGGGSRALSAKREKRGFFGSEKRQRLAEILAVADARTLTSLGRGGIGIECS